MLRFLVAASLAVACSLDATASAHSSDQVLIVVNAANPDSVRIGEYYAKKRSIRSDQILQLTSLPSDPADTIPREAFDRTISVPIARWLRAHSAQDRIAFIVLTKGIPLRIEGSAGPKGTGASIDSELALLYVRMMGVAAGTEGGVPNPYFLGDRPVDAAKPFSHEQWPIFLVSRLDGFTVDDVLGLIDRAAQPVTHGKFVLHGRRTAKADVASGWLRKTADRLDGEGSSRFQVVLDDSAVALTAQTDVLGYYSFGSIGAGGSGRHSSLQFLPGSIAALVVSTGARTFKEPPKDWAPGDARANSYAGSAEPLIGDLVHDGVAGVASYVAEPLIGNSVRPDILFPAYIAGYSAVESYYLALPALSWQTIVVADPLSAPFAASEVAPVPAATINPETELPAWYSDRVLKVLETAGTPAAAAKATARAEARLARDDVEGAVTALEDAVAADPSKVVRRMQLADLYERQARYDKAISQYREVVSLQPDNAAALNNLAYALAIREHDVQAALPFAQRAKALAPGNAAVLDTLGWIYYLADDATRAAFVLTDAVRLAPEDAAIGLHLVEALAAASRLDDARAELARVLARHPEIGDRGDIVALKRKLL
jgi:uncharacterized protein (TIGR03790 family)